MIIAGLAYRHRGAGQPVLRGVSAECRRGAVNVILGPNGCGKTTLFKCIAGLWRASEGKVLWDGTDILTLPEQKRSRLIAVVPQDHHPPFPYLVRDVVLMGRAAHIGALSAPGAADAAIAEEAMCTVGIDHLGGAPYTQISGGERQLTLLARALAQQTPILLLDEPTSHLDFRNQWQVLTIVRRIARDAGATVLMTLHDPNLALRFADHVLVLSGGAVQSAGLANTVITAETLARVYGMEVVVLSQNGTRMVSPKGSQ